MKKDYHIHAQILRENIDSEAFIQTAIARGFDEICITDHMPLSISNVDNYMTLLNYIEKTAYPSIKYDPDRFPSGDSGKFPG